jgi:hypothetical protein
MNKKTLLATVAAITLVLCSNIGCLEASWTGPTWRSPIQISPANFTTIRTHNISLTVETSLLDPVYSTLNEINEVYYEADWLPVQGYIFNHLTELQASGGMGNDVSAEWLQARGLEGGAFCQKNIEGEGWATQMVGRVLNLTGIPDGTHKLTVYAEIKLEKTGYSTASSSVSFEIEVGAPTIKILTLANNPNNKTETWLSFYSNQQIAIMSYSLDGQTGIVIPAENKTLTGLPHGVHSIVFYAKDLFGNTAASAPLTLTIPIPTPTPVPSPTLQPTESPSPRPTSVPTQQSGFLGTSLPVEYGYAIVAVLAVIIVAGLSLLYLKKQRRK